MRVFTALAAGLLLTTGILPAHDPHDPIVVVAISPNFANDQTILVATGGLTLKLGAIVLFKSVDGGVNWTVAAGLPNNSPIYSVTFSPNYANDSTVYVAGSGGFFMSTDGANTWQTLSSEFIVGLAISPNFATDYTLFVVNNSNKILQSKNRGTTLTPVRAPVTTSTLGYLAISPNFTVDHTLLVGSASGGIYRTANAGGLWVPVTLGTNLPSISQIVFSPSYVNDKTVFAATYGAGVLVSTSNGNSWSAANNGLTDTNVTSIALSPTFSVDSTMWATTAVAGVFQSTNRAAAWQTPTTVNRQLSNLTTTHYQYITATTGIQVLGMFEGLWISTKGAPWQYIDTCPTRFVRYINMSPNFPNDQTVFVSTYGSGNVWTTDGGATWTFQNNGMQAPYSDGSGISPNYTNDGTAWSGIHLGLQRTKDYGATWQMMTGPGLAAYPRGFAVSPNYINDQTVYIGITSAAGHSKNTGEPEPAGASPDSSGVAAGLWVSKNGGMNWTLSSLSGHGITSIAFSPNFANDRTAYAAAQTGTLYVTTNAALTWTSLPLPGNPNGVASVAVSPNFVNDHTVLAAALHGGLYITSNAGVSWEMIPSTRPIRGFIFAFSPNYANDQTFFVGTLQGGLMESTNAGASVVNIPTFPDVFVSAVGISPGFATDQTLFAAGYHGLFKSTDGGNTWLYMNNPARMEESRNAQGTLQLSGDNLQEPPTFVYAGQWQPVSAPAASTSALMSTGQNESTAVFSFLGTGVEWVSVTGLDQGSALVSIDGVSQGSVNMTTPPPDQYLQVVWSMQNLPCGNHTVSITATPAVLQSVSLDAFDVWLGNCPYTTFNFERVRSPK